MARSLGRHTIGFDARTGRKERYSDLIEDGEIPGLRVKRGTEDHEHPQKRLRRVGPDRQALYRPAPENAHEPVTVNIGYETTRDSLWSGRMYTPEIALTMGGFTLEFLELDSPFELNFSDFRNSQYVTLIFVGI